MNKLSLRRLLVSTAVAVTAVTAVATTTAHADWVPGQYDATRYANGCSGPPWNSLLDWSPPLLDPTTGFPFFLPIPRAFSVDFRLACAMHDAGYSGGYVVNPVTGQLTDTRFQDRWSIDVQFNADLKTLCSRTIPWDAPVALGTCFAIADTYFWAVRAAGGSYFDANPFAPGRQPSGTRPNN
jgi:hypothetical protein